jgi:hypothetical protein
MITMTTPTKTTLITTTLMIPHTLPNLTRVLTITELMTMAVTATTITEGVSKWTG